MDNLKGILEAMGMKGLGAVESLASGSGLPTWAAYHLVYRKTTPKYDRATRVKTWLMARTQEVQDQKLKRDLEFAIYALWRERAA